MNQPRPADSWIFIFFCFLIFWAPIPIGSNRGWSENLLYAGFWCMGCTLLWLRLKGRINTSNSLTQSRVVLALFFAIPAWALLQLLPEPFSGLRISQDISASIQSIQASLALAILFAITLQLVNTEKRLNTLALVIVASGVFQSCYAVFTILGGESFNVLGIQSIHARNGSATGTFLNRNHLAGYLEMSLAIGIGLMVSTIGKDTDDKKSWREHLRGLLRALLGPKMRQRLLLVAMVIALVMSHSRMGNTAFFASMGICAAIGYFIFGRHSKGMVLLFASMILIDLLIISSWFGLERLAERLEETGITREGRLSVNAEGLLWLKDYWLTGSGAGSFLSVFPNYRGADVVGFYDHAHNDYLQIAGEYGLIGSCLFAGIVGSVLWISIRAQRSRHTALMRGMAFGSMMGVISLLIHSATDFNLQIPANAALFTIVCGIACLSLHLGKHGQKRRRRFNHEPEHIAEQARSTP